MVSALSADVGSISVQLDCDPPRFPCREDRSHERRPPRSRAAGKSSFGISPAYPTSSGGQSGLKRVIGPGSSCWNRAWCSRRRSSRSIPREAAPRVRARRARCLTSSPRPTPIPTRLAARSSSIRRSSSSSPQTITLGATLVLSETAGPEMIDGPGAGLVTVSGGGTRRGILGRQRQPPSRDYPSQEGQCQRLAPAWAAAASTTAACSHSRAIP